MARARNIKPGFFSNETLAELPPLGRLLFVGLWTLADREGRIEDRPKRIKALVLPYDDCDIEALLTALAGKRAGDGRPAFIFRYSVAGRKLIQVVNWHRHQNPHKQEQASILPAPGEGPTKDFGTSSEEHPNLTGSPRADSLFSDSLNPPTPPKGGKRKRKRERERFLPPTRAEVAAYILERGYTFTADEFLDHYEANGWMRGKTAMKDWKATCRTWAHPRKDEAPSASSPAPEARYLP